MIFAELKFIVGLGWIRRIDRVESIQDVDLWVNTLLKNLCNVQEMMWVNSASCFWDFLLERWWDKFNPGCCFWLDAIVKNLCHVQEMTWVTNVSCFVKVHFRALMGQIQSGTLLLAWHFIVKCLLCSGNDLGEQYLVVCVG